jgi:hypothetical protein
MGEEAYKTAQQNTIQNHIDEYANFFLSLDK